MPFIFDFNNGIAPIETVDVYPDGWKGPITVEYVIAQAHKYDTTLSVVWRVKGTTCSFTIGEQRINHISGGDYAGHFKKALEGFRKDYLSWFEDEDYKEVEWKYEYKRQFEHLIND